MANEAVIISLTGQPKGRPISFTVADSHAVEKGALMGLFDPMTCSGTLLADKGVAFAGIAATEKVASDGQVKLGLWTEGIFDLVADADGITVGHTAALSGTNQVFTAVAGSLLDGKVVGRALETGSASEAIAVAVGIY